jgi:hypothetical protein
MPILADFSSNYILGSLPSRDASRLKPHLELVDLALNEVLCEPNRSSEYVHFPTDSLVALVVHDERRQFGGSCSDRQ